MSETINPASQDKPPLNIGNILSNTFGLYFRNFIYFFGVTLIPYVVFQVFTAVLVGDPNTLLIEGATAGFILLNLISVLIFVMLQAVLARSAVTARLGRGVEFAVALRAALMGLVPIILLGILVAIVAGVGYLLLIVPGLYLTAMFYVYVPAIVFENKGFSGLGRSISLTSGYRWAIVGLMLIFFALVFAISLVIGVVAGVTSVLTVGVNGAADPGTGFFLVLGLFNAVSSALVTPVGIIASALVFTRLREIKEGGSTEELLKVFE